MKITWQITSNDVSKVRKLVKEFSDKPFVRRRLERNCSTLRSPVRKAEFWREMVIARCTTQQRSGPNSHVGRFAREKPFPLKYEAVSKAGQIPSFISRTLGEWGGIRFVPKITKELTQNFEELEKSEWVTALRQCNSLIGKDSRCAEVGVANYIADTFCGFGPKQSRNLIQELGLTRYETPIDSRVTDWLNQFGFPIHLSGTGLADRAYYTFISDGIQELCAKSGVLPCVLDSIIFSMKDGDAWTEDILY